MVKMIGEGDRGDRLLDARPAPVEEIVTGAGHNWQLHCSMQYVGVVPIKS